LNYGAEICAHKYIEIGEEARIGTHCIIMDNDFHHVELARRDEPPPGDPIVLDPYVWVGNRVTILKGVHIGYGSVIAAGSVVTKSVPPMSIAAGVPARVLRRIDDAPGARPAPAQAHSVRASYSDGDTTPTYPQYLPPPPSVAGIEQ
jgi:acetyltransferase-like isoleucine patch superfamily enzyme